MESSELYVAKQQLSEEMSNSFSKVYSSNGEIFEQSMTVISLVKDIYGVQRCANIFS